MSKEDKCKIWMLTCVDHQFVHPDPIFIAWWLHKPSMKVLEEEYNKTGNSPVKSLLSELWAGKPILMGVETYTLQQVTEGFHN